MKTLKEYIVTENNFFKNLGIGQEALIKKWVEENCILRGRIGSSVEYTINSDMTIDFIDGRIFILDYNEKELPEYIQFRNVGGFCIRGKNLETLRGCPKECKEFNCSGCSKLKTLEFCPEECEIFSCNECSKLKDLKFAPKKCEIFCCNECNDLKSLDGCPQVWSLLGKTKVSCNRCNNLNSLKGVPKSIHEFDCSECPKLMSLEYCPKDVTLLRCSKCGGKFTKSDLFKLGINAFRCDLK
jgi:hypothetical protein